MNRWPILACALSALAAHPALALRPEALRTEYLRDPVAIDTRAPRFSWSLTPSRPVARGERQTAYRILAASSPERLRSGGADLWDSGMVRSAETIQVEYKGRPLRSFERCWWRVGVWDQEGRGPVWSDPAQWGMGPLQRSDWKARWIGCIVPRSEATDEVYLPAPCLRRAFTVRPRVRRATVYATAAGLYEMLLNGRRVGKDLFTPGWTEYAKRLYYQAYDVTGLLRPGANVWGATLGDGWYGLHHRGRGRLAFFAQMRIEYEDGRVETVATDAAWRASHAGPVRVSDIYNGEVYDARREQPGWSTAGFDDRAWQPVSLDFAGQVAASWKDVTEAVRQAVRDNALEVRASNDLFGDPIYGVVKRLEVRYRLGAGRERTVRAEEGQTLRIARTPVALTIVSARYGADATAGVDGAILQPHPGSPVRRTQEIKPVWVREPRPGAFVFNLGQNMVGWARLKVQGPAGTRVTLRFAEMLNPDGTIYTANLRRAKCTDVYILKGGASEVWEPRFTFHGFQYVEVTGYPGRPGPDAITGVVVHSDAPMTSTFACSNPMLNRLYQNIVWGQRGNYLEVPTDCPQRDERLGWSGDAQAFIGTAVFNMDIAPFHTAWMRTFNDSQSADGAYPNVSPLGGGVSPAWGDAGIICPWTIHRTYGDTRMLRDHWEGMKRWLAYLETRSMNLVRPAEGFGDWLNLGAEMPKDVISTAYFAYAARLMADMAGAIGKTEEARAYRDLFGRIREAFQKAFVAENGRIKGDTQTTYLMALGFDLLTPAQRRAAETRLVELIRERDDHLSVGFLGVNLLLPVLTDIGRVDLAWKLLTNETFPSWGYTVKHGATTIWERWDGWTHDKGFQDPGMNSFNHYAYGSCGEWMFKTAAGIDTDGTAYRRIRVRPLPGGGLTWLAASYDSIRGRISVRWSIADGRFRLDVTVPPNTTATVHVPAQGPGDVTEGGRPASQAAGVRPVGVEGGARVFAIGSGRYRFEAPYTP